MSANLSCQLKTCYMQIIRDLNFIWYSDVNFYLISKLAVNAKRAENLFSFKTNIFCFNEMRTCIRS